MVARSGLRSGDQIVAVDGIALESGNLHETIGQLRGHVLRHRGEVLSVRGTGIGGDDL